MSRYTETKEMSFNDLRHSRIVHAESEDLEIQLFNGSNWVSTGTTVLAGETEDIITRGLVLRFVVQAGGAFYIEEGVGA